MSETSVRFRIAVLGLACLAGCAGPAGRGGGPGDFESLFEPMGKPRPGEWLFVRPEPGQAVADYVRSSPNRPTPERRRVVVAPLGGIAGSEPALLSAAGEFLEAFFGLPVSVSDPDPVPEGARDDRRKQHDAARILDALASGLPADAAAGVGVLEVDLLHQPAAGRDAAPPHLQGGRPRDRPHLRPAPLREVALRAERVQLHLRVGHPPDVPLPRMPRETPVEPGFRPRGALPPARGLLRPTSRVP
ncbi:MAG: hypothetical protein MUC63_10745, partial [Planctomycetes bacterium]|nr:hypothetical protein [Planctomycetota bacterium]